MLNVICGAVNHRISVVDLAFRPFCGLSDLLAISDHHVSHGQLSLAAILVLVVRLG